MTATLTTGLWRPFDPDDEPLFTPLLLEGFDSLPDEEAARLTAYLGALIERRGVLHPAVAFNAIYFGYDLTYDGYVGGPLELAEFPAVATGQSGDALPVGAMITVPTGGDPLYAEVVYKEGAHPVIGADGDLPAWLSGAPAGARGPGLPPEVSERPVLTERLVLDFDAFGAGLAATPARLSRLKAAGLLLDGRGHITRDAMYPDPGSAEATDLDFYASWLLDVGRTQLLGGPLPLLLADGSGEAELAAALRAGLGAVANALSAVPGVLSWRGYTFARAGLARRMRDDGPLGESDLASFARRLARIPQAQSRRFGVSEAARYTAVGLVLAEVDGAGPQLAGVGYPLAVCHANTVMADSLPEGGRTSAGMHVRLDDAWQAGGVWRSTTTPGIEVTIDPLTPLGLGWAGTLPSPAADEPAAAAEDEAETEPAPDAVPDLLGIDDSHAAWTVPLRLSNLLTGTLPVPARVAVSFGEQGLAGSSLRLALTHDGYDLDPDEANQSVTVPTEIPDGAAVRLEGAQWPLEFFPGIVLTCIWPVGARIVRATSTLADEPVTIDGTVIEHRFDPRILTPETAPGQPWHGAGRAGGGAGSTAARRPGPLSLKDRILAAVRTAGLLDEHGVAVLARSALAELVYGTGAGPNADAALTPVVTALVAAGVLTCEFLPATGGALVIWPVPVSLSAGTPLAEALLWRPITPVPAGPRTGSDGAGGGRQGLYGKQLETPEPLVPVPPRDPGPLHGFVLAYDVASFLRRLPPGAQASEEKRAEYRRRMARYGKAAELPNGFTLVTGHTRHR